MKFNGADYQPKRDNKRLENQHKHIKEFMSDGVYRTLSEISQQLGYPESSISAQLRHLRKARFGGHTINKTYISNGLYKYQLILNKTN